MLILLAVLPAQVHSQERPQRARVWAAGGMGGGGSSNAGGLGFMGELVFQKQPHHIALRAVGMVDIYDAGSRSIAEVSLLYGRAVTGRVGHAVIASGVALAGGDLCSSPSEAFCKEETTLGIPVVAEVALRPLPIAGLGLQAFININPKALFGGVIVFVQLGWLP